MLRVKTSLEKTYELAIAAYVAFAVYVGLVNDMRIFPEITNITNWIMFIFGVALIFFKYRVDSFGSKIYQRARTYRSPQRLILTLFFIVNIISILLNLKYDFGRNLQSLGYMFVLFYLFYEPAEVHSSTLYSKRLFSGLARGTVVLTFVLTFISLLTYIFGVFYSVREVYKIGFDINSNRLWGVYNPNGGSLIALISTGSSLYLINSIYEKHRVKIRYSKDQTVYLKFSDKLLIVFLTVNIFCQYTYIILAQSRAVLTATYLFVLLISIGFIFNHHMKKIENPEGKIQYPNLKLLSNFKLKNLGVAILASLTIVVLMFYGNKLYLNILSKVPQNLAGVRNYIFELDDNQQAAKFFISSEELEQIGSGRKAETKRIKRNHGRLLFWEETIKAVQESPVIGLSYDGLIKEVNAKMPDESVKEHLAAGGVHSMIFSVLGASGLLGLMLFVLYLLLQQLDIILMFVEQFNHDHSFKLELLIIYGVLVSILLVDLVESRILYNINYIAILYWIFAGVMNDKSIRAYNAVEKELVRSIQK